MPKFALRKIESIKGKQQFYELLIDNVGQIDVFEKTLEKKYLSELTTIQSYMDFVANLKSLPENKFKDITPDKVAVKEYEFKSKHLRVYAIKTENGKIVILCGHKNTQAENIKKFQSIKKQYLNSI